MMTVRCKNQDAGLKEDFEISEPGVLYQAGTMFSGPGFRVFAGGVIQ